MTLAEFLDSLQTTWPARMVQGAVQGAMAPGNAFASSWGNPVTTEQMVAPAANLAGFMAGTPGGTGGFGSGLRAAIKIGDRIFAGPNHVIAMDQARKVLGHDVVDNAISATISGKADRRIGGIDGFLTPSGAFLTRAQAAQLVAQPRGFLRAEDLR